MLNEMTRSAILRLREEGHGSRRIAKALGISRASVRVVVERGTNEVPRPARAEKAEPHRAGILELFASCKGNMVRVHEELAAQGVVLSYQALTGFCRRHGIGHDPVVPVGRYVFAPGKEMQHDTSPHVAKVGGKLVKVETASLQLAHSTMLFFQHYPRFVRFTCKTFLHDAMTEFAGACEVCMIDNTHVVVLRGTGQKMVPVPEMEAFGDRYGFKWAAHEVGDPDRKGGVERAFHFIETNFLAGREFRDLEHLNAEARAWCDKVNAKFRKRLHAAPREIFAAERTRMKPLPLGLEEPYQLHHRIVDVEGYVSVHATRYSVPYQLIGRRLEARETKGAIVFCEGPRVVATHTKGQGVTGSHVTKPEHRPPRGHATPREPSVEERTLLAIVPELADYVALLKKRSPGNGTLALRRLLGMMRDYPRDAFLQATLTAARYFLTDLERVERMVLRGVTKDYFPTLLDRHIDPDDQEPGDD